MVRSRMRAAFAAAILFGTAVVILSGSRAVDSSLGAVLANELTIRDLASAGSGNRVSGARERRLYDADGVSNTDTASAAEQPAAVVPDEQPLVDSGSSVEQQQPADAAAAAEITGQAAPQLDPAVQQALAAADGTTKSALDAAQRKSSDSAAHQAAAAAQAVSAAAHAAALQTAGSPGPEALAAVLEAARLQAVAAAEAAQAGQHMVHAATAAALVSLAASEAGHGRQWASDPLPARAAEAVYKATRVTETAGRKGGGVVPGASLTAKDIVHVTFTTAGRHGVATASRVWRKPLGVRAVIITNVNATEYSEAELAENFETWGYYPDVIGREEVTYYPGDYRAATAPLVAHRLLAGDYKWIIFGDDDTVFFPEGVIRALEAHRLDAELPHFVSDSQWGFGVDGNTSPAEWNPRCVPCNFDAAGKDEGSVPVPPLRGCPCTVAAVCSHWQQHLPGKVFQNCNEESLREPSPHWLGIHGDAGALFSVGLMRKLDWDSYEACVHNVKFYAGGDNKVSRCIWMAGYAMTDPGYSYLSGDLLQKYTFDRWTLRINGDPVALARLLQEKVLGLREPGFCEPHSQPHLCMVPDKMDELLVTMVSTHARARGATSIDQVVNLMDLLSTVYRLYMKKLEAVHPEAWRLNLEVDAGSSNQ